MRKRVHGQPLTHVSVMMFFNMESPSVCPRGPCQAEPYSRYSRWHAECNFGMYSAPAQPLTKGPETHVMDIMHTVTTFGGVIKSTSNTVHI